MNWLMIAKEDNICRFRRMQDRLKELVEEPAGTSLTHSEVNSTRKDHTEEEQTDEFLNLASQFRESLNSIHKKLDDLYALYQRSITNSESNSEINNSEKDVHSSLILLKDGLKEMQDDKANYEKGTAEYRIRDSTNAQFFQKTMETIARFQQMQEQFRSKVRDFIAAKYRIVKPEATDEDINEAIERGDVRIFEEEILGERHKKAKQALAYVENKLVEIKIIEREIGELSDLFSDLALLVDCQNEHLDVIEKNVLTAVENAKKASKDLKEANKRQKSSRKKMAILAAILVGVTAIMGGGGAALKLALH